MRGSSQLRAQLIAQGAHVAAPCPHDGKCPLKTTRLVPLHPAPAPLPRAPAVKGAELPFEDEKFAYVALTRAPIAQHPARVLAQPVVTKVEVTAKLCAPEGLVIAKVPRRAKAGYAPPGAGDGATRST